jgi:hypothetical protein
MTDEDLSTEEEDYDLEEDEEILIEDIVRNKRRLETNQSNERPNCDINEDKSEELAEDDDDIQIIDKMINNDMISKASTQSNESSIQMTANPESNSINSESIVRKDASTDSRFKHRTCDSIDRTTGLMSHSISSPSLASTSTSTKTSKSSTVKVFRCVSCGDRFGSLSEFKSHSLSRHPSESIRCSAFRENLINNSSNSESNDSTHSSSFSQQLSKECNNWSDISLNNPIINSSLKSSSDLIIPQTSFIDKCESQKSSKRAKSSSLDSNNCSVSSNQLEIRSKLQFRVSYQCRICSFTPLFRSKETIKSHIREEHKKSGKEVKDNYQEVMVRSVTRTTIV